jgi:hypothetical protein
MTKAKTHDILCARHNRMVTAKRKAVEPEPEPEPEPEEEPSRDFWVIL